jgi:transcriptional regulator with XRE-family HTH domain
MGTEDRASLAKQTGDRVAFLRAARGWTVSELAAAAGIPRQYVYDLEDGVRVSVRNVVGAARALDVTTDYLLGLASGPSRVPPRRSLTGDPVGPGGDLEDEAWGALD